MVKILKVEDLKNDDIVEKIKRELSQQITFHKSDNTPVITKKVTPVEVTDKNVKEDPESKHASESLKKTPKYIRLSRERMERFLNMTKEDIRPKPKHKFACELEWSKVKKPVDTLRCEKCGVLYQRDVYKAHTAVCKGGRTKSKFGCTKCNFTHFSFKELETHLAQHSQKTSSVD